MKIFVTGGTGFIGSHCLKVLMEAGHEVVALHYSIPTSTRIPLPSEPRWLKKSLAEVTVDDLAGCQVLIHLAAAGVTPQPATWELCFRVNVVETIRLIENASQAGVKRVVVAGSYAEYGLAGLRYARIPPDAPLEPTDPYAASKAAASVALGTMCRNLKFELAYYRLFSIYGEGQFGKNFWPQLREAALSGQDFPMTAGDQVRDFISVEEAARLILKAVDRNDIVAGQPWLKNLASGNPVTLREFAESQWKLFGAQGKILFGSIPNRPNEVKCYIPEV